MAINNAPYKLNGKCSKYMTTTLKNASGMDINQVRVLRSQLKLKEQ